MAEILGSITPRLFTPPLVTGPAGPCGCGCALTPDTSYGFDVERFSRKKLRREPWPWQRWLYIHAGELDDRGFPRFRRLIVTVARQSGKTRGVEDLSLFWMFEEEQPSILGTSTLTKYAKKPWYSAFELAASLPSLRDLMPDEPHRKAIRRAAGEEEWWNLADSHYAIAASNAEGGRSMSNTRVIADEFAKQYTYDAYGAAYYSMESNEDGQYFALTTPDPKGEPYRDLRGSALNYVKTGIGDPSLGLFEWSAPRGADPTDPRVLALANPTMNRPGGKDGRRLLREAAAAVAKGGLLRQTFETEILCILDESSERPFDLDAWSRGLDPAPMDDLRGRVATCFDVAPSMLHATLYAAAMLPDGRVRVEVIKDWEGRGCADQAARDLPAVIGRVKPRRFGWLPSGPAAAVGGRLAERGRRSGSPWPPPGVQVEEIRGELTQVAMGLSQLIAADQVLHSGDPLLDGQMAEAQKLTRGDGWVISRKGDGDVDAVYAAAGAAWLAQLLPPPSGGTRVLLPRVRG